MSLKPLPAEKVLKALAKVGFRPIRQRGSHVILRNDEGKVTVLPVHKGEKIGVGLLNKIIRDAGLSREEFLELI